MDERDFKAMNKDNKPSGLGDVSGSFSSSKQEEIFMYLSIITALVAYRLDITWMVWVFGIKAVIEFISSISLAVKEIIRKRKNLR